MMRILSLNLHCLQEQDQEKKAKVIANFIKENNVDVCLFQEVAQNKDNAYVFKNFKEGNNAYLIYKELEGYNVYYEFKKYGFDIYEEGLAIMTKEKMLANDFFYISKSRDMSWLTRIVIKASILYNNKIIDFYTVHMGWTVGSENYFNQSNEVINRISNSNLAIIAGDFNCYHKSAEYNSFIDKGLISFVDEIGFDTLNNPTFSKELDACKNAKNRTIDFFFSNKNIEIKKYEIVFKDYLVSDHYGIYTEIDV